MPYTAEETDELCSMLEKAERRLEKHKDQKVKRNAAEKDILKVAELCRDLMFEALGNEKSLLEEVFGGDCVRFHRFNNCRLKIEFSDINASDERWEGMLKQMVTIEKVLQESGMFKPWQKSTAPEKVYYLSVPSYIDFEAFECTPIVEGCSVDSLNFSIFPELPMGMVFDENTGVISGQPVSGKELPERVYTITASNAAGSQQTQIKFGVRYPEPGEISYEGGAKHAIYVGEDIAWEPYVAGGPPKQWEVNPDLPRGLFLDPVTGILSGMAITVTPPQEYTIRAGNSAGSSSTTIQFSVEPAPPKSIQYSDAWNVDFPFRSNVYLVPEVIIEGEPTADEGLEEERDAVGALPSIGVGKTGSSRPDRGSIMSSSRGSHLPRSKASRSSRLTVAMSQRPPKQNPSWERTFAANGTYMGQRWNRPKLMTWETKLMKGLHTDITFSIEPALPEGMSISKTTGTISGRPVEQSPRTTYTVTAVNGQGSCSTDLNFGVKLSPPTGLHYPVAPENTFDGEAVSFSPEVTGWVSEWQVEPELPTGLMLDKILGTIDGVPQGVAPMTTYTVKAINEAGETSIPVKFAVKRQAPKSLSYPRLHTTFAKDRPIKPTFPHITGNSDLTVEADDFRVKPPLPEGITLNPKTGEISGTPTVVAPLDSYVITASNESGSCSKSINFKVDLFPPSGLVYPSVDGVYAVGELVVLKPKVKGVAANWSIEGTLPTGLKFDTTSGIISGIPTEITELREFIVTASNDSGGSSVVIQFDVSAPKPKSLSYPEIGSRLLCGKEIVAEPSVAPIKDGLQFSVEPALPTGLTLDPSTGVISGSPVDSAASQEFTVTATNSKGSTTCALQLACEKPPENEYTIDEAFCAALEEVTDVSQLPPEPSTKRIADWMVWMVHRAHLNDPTLEVFDFTMVKMPMPHDEPRVAPKLMKAMANNTHIKSLLLPNANVRNPQAIQLAEALKVNDTLEVLNLENNYLAPDGIEELAGGLAGEHSKVSTLRFASQQERGSNYGRKAEQAVAQMLGTNHMITKLGFIPSDPHWANEINRRLIINHDMERRRRKGEDQEDEEDLPAQQKLLVRCIWEQVPEKAVWEVLDDDNAKINLARKYTCSRRQLPNRQHLQAWAKSQGEPLKYSEVAPLVKQFNAMFTDAMLGMPIKCQDNVNKTYEGILVAWSERNFRYHFDVKSRTERWAFETEHKPPNFEISEDLVEWLRGVQ